MIERLKRLLELPAVFDAYQLLIGENRAKRAFVDEWIDPASGERLLDVGCGTGAMAALAPADVEVVGIDISEAYISAAQKRRLGSRAEFRVGDAADPDLDLGGGFDAAYAYGVLHHLADDAALRLVQGAVSRQRPGGRFLAMDPTLIAGQGAVSRFFVTNDRGRYVRTPEQMNSLLGQFAPHLSVHTNQLRIPFARLATTITRR